LATNSQLQSHQVTKQLFGSDEAVEQAQDINVNQLFDFLSLGYDDNWQFLDSGEKRKARLRGPNVFWWT